MVLRLQRLVYRILLWLALPFIPLRLLLRGFKERGYWRQVPERFGFCAPMPERPVWIHAVSVGEARAAAPLVARFLALTVAPPVLITCMTPAGRVTLQQMFGDKVSVCYLPYDYPSMVRRFLRRVRPRLGLIMETELWPNLVREADRARMPLLLVNARLSAQSALRYQRLRTLTRSVLQGFAGLAAQTEEDAERLRELGAASVVVTGNLKFDLEPPADQLELGRAMRKQVGERPVWLAASTRAGEEKLILDAFCRTAPANVLLVLVPRHPQRFDEVAALARDRGLSLQRRSGNDPVQAGTRVWLGDSLGEMFAYYAMADCALIGGSLLPYGGQNLIEACAVGCPALLGPHTENFKQAAEDAISRGAALRVANAGEWAAQAALLMQDASVRQGMAAAGRAFAAAHRGAAQRTWTSLQLAARSQAQLAAEP